MRHHLYFLGLICVWDTTSGHVQEVKIHSGVISALSWSAKALILGLFFVPTLFPHPTHPTLHYLSFPYSTYLTYPTLPDLTYPTRPNLPCSHLSCLTLLTLFLCLVMPCLGGFSSNSVRLLHPDTCM
jgi:hypothetical protein